MSPELVTEDAGIAGFPRVSGDEPAPVNAMMANLPFSPRERG